MIKQVHTGWEISTVHTGISKIGYAPAFESPLFGRIAILKFPFAGFGSVNEDMDPIGYHDLGLAGEWKYRPEGWHPEDFLVTVPRQDRLPEHLRSGFGFYFDLNQVGDAVILVVERTNARNGAIVDPGNIGNQLDLQFVWRDGTQNFFLPGAFGGMHSKVVTGAYHSNQTVHQFVNVSEGHSASLQQRLPPELRGSNVILIKVFRKNAGDSLENSIPTLRNVGKAGLVKESHPELPRGIPGMGRFLSSDWGGETAELFIRILDEKKYEEFMNIPGQIRIAGFEKTADGGNIPMADPW